MAVPLESSVVRIYSKSGKVVGAGFLVSSKHVLTCAHVVTDALGLGRKTTEKPDLEISLDFPLLAPRQLFTAKVIFWRPENQNEQIEDIAGLELVNSPPNTAEPAQMVKSEDLWEHPFRVLGFPAGQPNGVSASGVLRGRIANGWVQVEDVKEPGYRLEPGFSGAPVWDEKLQGVVGMAVAAEMNRVDVKAAFIIPASILMSAWPDLGKQAISTCPYRGLLAFQEKDAEFFFGREMFIDSLVEIVYQQPLLAVIGSSGSGKSSVVLAGLIPKLREEENWLIESFRPQSQPFYGLASALVRVRYSQRNKNEQDEQTSNLFERMQGNRKLWQEVTDILAEKPGKRLLLVIDQFEELYALNTKEQQKFVNALLEAIQENPRRLKLVLTIRTDFLDYIINYPPFKEAALQQDIPQYLGAMNEKEMKSVIEPIDRKTQKKIVELEDGLTQRILDDVQQEPGNLPLLEFALTQLWSENRGGILTLQTYEKIGGVRKALANHADKIYHKLDEEEKKQVQQIFVQLARPGEKVDVAEEEKKQRQPSFVATDTRRLATRAEIREDNWRLVQKLASVDRDIPDKEKKLPLLVTGRNEKTGEQTVEVVHEALIREWGKLQEWIDNDRTFLTWRHQLRTAMKQWNVDKDEGALLRGKPLVIAEDWLQKRQADLTNEWKYIQASLNLRKKEIEEQESQQQRITVARTLAICLLIAFLGLVVFFNIDTIKLAFVTVNKKHLAGSNLAQSNFPGANLSAANLSKANLSYSNLQGANLSAANLSEANLSQSNFPGANLLAANLSKANLSYSNLQGANLSAANLSEANLSQSNFPGANLLAANLSKANLSQSNLQEADLSQANLQRADLRKAFLKKVNFSQANLSQADLSGETVRQEANLSKANLQKANLRETFMKKVNFSEADLSQANLSGGTNGTILEKSNLSGANLQETELENTYFFEANLSSANLSKANLRYAKLEKANFQDADISGANFKETYGLNPDQVKRAKNWQKAKYDADFRKKLGLK